MRLLKLAQSRSLDDTTSFESFITEEGFSIEELEQLAEATNRMKRWNIKNYKRGEKISNSLTTA